MVADTGALLLESHGYKARAAYTAEQAIETGKDLHPHVLIVDAVLPEWTASPWPSDLPSTCPLARWY
jgi:DNA-binding response OmpR family regulator